MAKYIITADLHGSYNSWLTLTALLGPDDTLVIAGDLFDTRYGNYSHIDFQPESIKKALNTLCHPFYYVYGNCDTPSFFPGFSTTQRFIAFNKTCFLHHGHKPCSFEKDSDIIIQGHTHLSRLDKKNNRIFLNPGSITCPRDNVFTYGIIDHRSVNLIDLKTGNALSTITF